MRTGVRGKRSRKILILVALLLGIVGLLAGYRFPLWAYNIERAGRLIDRGLSWPEPRRADSLPVLQDAQPLDAALGHLAAALRWRPFNAHAYRMAGQVYVAKQEWLKAADALDRAASLDPGNPILHWERGLVYEQLGHAVGKLPRETIMPDLASGLIEAPSVPIDTTFCRDNRAETCYVGLDRWSQRLASSPTSPLIAVDTLFMHPPAAASLDYRVWPDHPVLYFLMGLDPNVRPWKSDGATFEVWVTAQDGKATPVYMSTLDANTARQGWVPGSADLTQWSGQTIKLTLRTHGGPSGDVTDDWYGWGNVMFTTSQGPKLLLLRPMEQMHAAWKAAGLTGEDFVRRAEQARSMGRQDEALAWERRAVEMAPAVPARGTMPISEEYSDDGG